MTRVPPPGNKNWANVTKDRDWAGGGLRRVKYENAPTRVNAGKPNELTWREKIILRRVDAGESLTSIARVQGVGVGRISAMLKKTALRFGVKTYRELVVLPSVQEQLGDDDDAEGA